ncbi:MAG: DUF4336 domain-containing protein [Alphaproteobacteria bacterium]|nr:DUF4336 domain-containing protein [Alphaproteobacteria bacterium]MBU1516651.1 DUF4336 domain-containing protein [Alphaproteobacteria bacterium]MBU2094407.1 DUF4336 domain-containing protein [Alphaproteobacteria bacterium]MBU2153292.1 DUF4336 domain-containing protein [Alphaproteobacteria bacterium]MBU2307578.1 DUF4336 domain-containing protein [Alphaproteobacteria bacterium]
MRPSAPLEAYAPLNVLKPVAPDIWIVDGPTIRFGLVGLSLPISTRMTIVRLRGRDLFIHSPTALTPELQAAIATLGTPRWLIGPNRLHYWWLPEWKAAYPGAQAYLAPRLPQQAHRHLSFEGRPLTKASGYPWDGHLQTLPVAGRFMTEVVFFHTATRTLILTDLIENFEAQRIHARWMRRLTRFAGVQAPHGGMACDMRLTFPRAPLRQAVERMLAWRPERVVIAHGRGFENDGATRLRRAFQWLLD